jgi:hypothetical protein
LLIGRLNIESIVSFAYTTWWPSWSLSP